VQLREWGDVMKKILQKFYEKKIALALLVVLLVSLVLVNVVYADTSHIVDVNNPTDQEVAEFIYQFIDAPGYLTDAQAMSLYHKAVANGYFASVDDISNSSHYIIKGSNYHVIYIQQDGGTMKFNYRLDLTGASNEEWMFNVMHGHSGKQRIYLYDDGSNDSFSNLSYGTYSLPNSLESTIVYYNPGSYGKVYNTSKGTTANWVPPVNAPPVVKSPSDMKISEMELLAKDNGLDIYKFTIDMGTEIYIHYGAYLPEITPTWGINESNDIYIAGFSAILREDDVISFGPFSHKTETPVNPDGVKIEIAYTSGNGISMTSYGGGDNTGTKTGTGDVIPENEDAYNELNPDTFLRVFGTDNLNGLTHMVGNVVLNLGHGEVPGGVYTLVGIVYTDSVVTADDIGVSVGDITSVTPDTSNERITRFTWEIPITTVSQNYSITYLEDVDDFTLSVKYLDDSSPFKPDNYDDLPWYEKLIYNFNATLYYFNNVVDSITGMVGGFFKFVGVFMYSLPPMIKVPVTVILGFGVWQVLRGR